MNKVFIIFILCLTSCNLLLKKNSIFVKDSVFLSQGHNIKEYKPRVNKKFSEKNLNVKGLKKETFKQMVKNNDEKIFKDEFPFKVGEEVVLLATYFGVKAGKILIGVNSFKSFEGKKQYHFYAYGRTSSIFSVFYKVKNKIEALWDPVLKKPKSLALNAVESKQKYKTRVYFDWLNKKGDFLKEGWKKKKGNYKIHKKWVLQRSAQDILSTVFYIRALPLIVGKEYKLAVMKENKIIDVYFKVDRKEILNTRVGKINALVLKPRFSVKGKFNKVGDISVWLSDDSYRQIIRIESRIKIGTIVAKLHSRKIP